MTGYKNKMKRSTICARMHVLLLMGIVFLAFLVGEIEGGLKSVGVTKNRGGKGGRGGRGGGRKTMAGRMAKFDEMGNAVAGEGDDYVEPCVGVCQYHREMKWKRENGITDPPTTTSTTLNPADRTTKDYGRNAKEIGRGSALPGPWPGRSPGVYFAIASSILVTSLSSFLVGNKASKQLYFSGGGNCVSQLKLL